MTIDFRSTRWFHFLSKLKYNRETIIKSFFLYYSDIKSSNHSKNTESDYYISINESMGRFLFFLLRYLTFEGKTATFLGDIHFLDYLDKYGKLSLDLEEVNFQNKIPTHSENKVLIHDGSNSDLSSKKWKKIIHIDFDISSNSSSCGSYLFMPFPMHPSIYWTGQDKKLSPLRDKERRLKIFYAGNVNPNVYDSYKNRYLRERFRKLLRPEIIEILKSQLEDEILVVKNHEQMRKSLDGNESKLCVLVEISKDFSVPRKDWLSTVASSSFFLCPPGVSMPPSHNSVESMAVGTIPIINYADWFHPRLEHMQNCIEFTDREDLIRKIKLVLDMDESAIQKLKENVIEYYEKYLTPESFSRQISGTLGSETTLFVNIEKLCYLHGVTEKSVAVN